MKTNAAELEHILQKSHAEKTNLETALADSLNKIELQNRQRESDNHLQQVCNNQQIKVSNACHKLILAGEYETFPVA